VSSLVVVGAGPIGAAAAQQAAAAAVAARVVLVDPAADVARGLALDICQSGAVTGTSTMVEGTGDTGAVVGARVIIVADRHGGAGEWRGDEGLAMVAALRALNPGALVVCAGTAQDMVVEQMVAERGGDARRHAGSAPEALRVAMVALAALEAGVAPGEVALSIVGRWGRDLFTPWEGASIGGARATDVLSPPVLARLERQTPLLWPPGALALGAAAARVARIALTRAPGRPSLFVVPVEAGEGPRRGVTAPAVIAGVEVRPVWPPLAPRERVRFESAARGPQ
jgi:malate/lactate dehydrogenase